MIGGDAAFREAALIRSNADIGDTDQWDGFGVKNTLP